MLALVVALVAASADLASADEPTIVQVGGPLPIINGGFSPTALPRNKLAHIAMDLSSKVETPEGTHPPALHEVILELDKNVAVGAKGLPRCPRRVEEEEGEERCRPALVGRGTMEVEVEFPEQKPFIAKSKLLAFNGGVKGGVTTIFTHAYLSAPVSAAVVTTIEVSKVHNGRYGTNWVETFPKIAGGYGSITSFSLTVDRQFTYRGKRRSYLLAKCPDGHLNAHATSIFSDGSEQPDSFVRPCTPKG